MKKSIQSLLALVCICAVVTVALALTNSLTAPIIDKNESASANAALLEVLPDGGAFEALDISAYTLPSTVTEAYRAENGGYVMKLETTGYASGLVLMCGVNADSSVSGVVCLSSGETLGYEKTYGANFIGKTADEADAIDTVSGATKTTGAIRSAVKDALNAAVILGGGSVDIRTEEEILNDNLSAALPAAEGAFEKHFFVEVVEGVDAIYTAVNGAGSVCVIGEQFIGVDADGAVVSECDDATASVAKAAVEVIGATVTEDIDLSAYEGLPSHLTLAKRTESGNYVLEIKGAGYGITGGDDYHPASGEYIMIRISMTADGRIIDCLTLSEEETDGIGSACADEAFYGQFDGKTAENYTEIDAISGATLTTDGYKKAIGRAFDSVKILEGGAK